jgi:hypothetical protein
VPGRHATNEVPALIDSTVRLEINSVDKAFLYQKLMKMRYASYPNALKSRCVGIIEPGVSIYNNCAC